MKLVLTTSCLNFPTDFMLVFIVFCMTVEHFFSAFLILNIGDQFPNFIVKEMSCHECRIARVDIA
jgi:hypothetical protein